MQFGLGVNERSVGTRPREGGPSAVHCALGAWSTRTICTWCCTTSPGTRASSPSEHCRRCHSARCIRRRIRRPLGRRPGRSERCKSSIALRIGPMWRTSCASLSKIGHTLLKSHWPDMTHSLPSERTYTTIEATRMPRSRSPARRPQDSVWRRRADHCPPYPPRRPLKR